MNMIGTRIKERRKQLGLTQMQIKAKSGISSGNMSDIENGNIIPSAATLILLSKVLECSIDWMLTGFSLNDENSSFSEQRDFEAFKLFEQLTPKEKDELIELMEFKLARQKKKGKSSHSTGGSSEEFGSIETA